jgi:hypothetical protein
VIRGMCVDEEDQWKNQAEKKRSHAISTHKTRATNTR